MCTTKRYVFLCQHPATHRFRDTVCDSPSVRGCVVRDFNIQLTYPCKKCFNRGIGAMHVRIPDPAFDDDVWHVPSRCFFDVGYRTLNPFQEGRSPDSCRPTSPAEPPIPENGHSLIQAQIEEDSSVCKRLIRRLTLKRKAESPCCARDSQGSPFLATRIEGSEQRIRGRIMEDRCESPF